jgi:hypothetical protein
MIAIDPLKVSCLLGCRNALVLQDGLQPFLNLRGGTVPAGELGGMWMPLVDALGGVLDNLI